MLNLRHLADDHDADSLSNRMRSRRFQRFADLADSMARPLSILDVGGEGEFWAQRGWGDRQDVQITLVNIQAEPQRFSNIIPVVGDATNLSTIRDGQFDIAFSNSVIEHLFTFENQAAMAREVRRVARAYWVQTPNYWFPIEPHFHVPGWQWMPEILRVGLIRRRRCGWRGPCPDPEGARRLVREIRLMTARELRNLFPDATLVPERFMGMVKSWVVHHGFPVAGHRSTALTDSAVTA